MSFLDDVFRFVVGSPAPEQTRSSPTTALDFALRVAGATTVPYRIPTIDEALSVPAIQRAVTLISKTTGSLTPQAFRNGALMEETPSVIARPDPYQTPDDFYRDWAYYFATRGEAVHYITKRDSDGNPASLFLIPAPELTVEENQRNRLFPVYTWGQGEGKKQGTRYSAANRTGDFLHTTYLKEPGSLRGKGPLQMARAAISVSVEAQEWAANFYAGGNGSSLIKYAGDLSAMEDEDAESEVSRFKAQWMARDNNTPMIIDQNIESVDYKEPNEAGAQMLESRQANNGDGARLFGIPGVLLEYSAPGSSLTYQNVAAVWTQFLRGCLYPNYLEPIEQALADILPRSQNVQFRTDGLQRADILTRAQVYQILVPLGILPIEDAQQAEGIIPGSPEVMPIPFAPPAAVPTELPQLRSVERRCTAKRMKRISGVSLLRECHALLSDSGYCAKCKREYEAA